MSFKHHSRCICSPNANDDQNRDCPVHRPTSMTFGISLFEIRDQGGNQ